MPPPWDIFGYRFDYKGLTNSLLEYQLVLNSFREKNIKPCGEQNL